MTATGIKASTAGNPSFLETPRPVLTDGTIRLLHAQLSAPPRPIEDLRALISDPELARAARFVHEADAHRHILGRGLARVVLGTLTGLEPRSIDLHTSPEGKPFLPGGPSFSIAHSGPLVLLAFATEGRLGVDAEATRVLHDLPRLARATFNPPEVHAVLERAGAERQAAFYRVWTRKEAMLKALGSGLSALASLTVSAEDVLGNALLAIEPPEIISAWDVRSTPARAGVAAAVAWDRPIRDIEPLLL